ncbi:MAG: xylulokinase [Firmicutes bacterium]|nr:xylulokinase [Bacillota bacterium]
MYFIGIDLGTSAVKLLLMDESGRVERVVSRPYPLRFPHPGWAEQDPRDWYEQTTAGLRELTEGIDPSGIEAISFAGQMHGLVALDEQDQVIRPAILWNDGRTGAQVRYLNETIGRDALIRYTSNIAFAGFTAPKLLWMREHEPDLFGRIDKIMLPKDYLLYRFTGVHATDYSDASGTLLLDVPRKSWSEPMLEICGIRADVLPKLHESWETAGTLREDAAGATGLAAGTRVVTGAADNAAAAIGTGTIGSGSCNLSLGTSGTLFVCGDDFTARADTPVHYFVHADGGFHLLGCMLSAASCNQWWCEDILGTNDYDGETQLIERSRKERLGRNRVFFAPYLTGERSPHNDPDVRGCFIGLSRDTGRAEMTQAIYEGVSFGLRDCLEAARALGANVTEATICGGGAKSKLWRTITANILNLPVTTVVNEEGPGFGAAILAAVGSGAFDNVAQAAGQLVQRGETIAPDPLIAEKYQKQYETYRRIYPAIRELF